MTLTDSDIERFWAKVDKSGDCWEWTGGRQGKGYGSFWLKNSMRPAHRISWELHNGSIPDGLYVLHKCDNRICINPKHLFLGTNQENMTDRNLKGRQARGEKIGIAKLTWESVEEIRNLHSDGISQYELAERFGVDTSRICRIIHNKIWVK